MAMRSIFTLLGLALGAAAGAQADAASTTLESATMGAGGRTGGHSVSANQLIGWRFHVTTPMAVTEVGGHLGSVSGYVFAALVSLNSLDAVPAGTPLPDNVVAHALLVPPVVTADFRVSLSALLTPGSYALVFGSGQFGATGRGFMPDVQQTNVAPTTSTSYIAWRQTLPGQFNWTTGGIDRVRFAVVASQVAGPTDFNLDGRIDAGDLAVWRGHYNSSTPGGIATGDADRDGDTDGADFLAWQRALGTGIAAPALAAPEPRALALVVQSGALAGLLVRGRARRSGGKL